MKSRVPHIVFGNPSKLWRNSKTLSELSQDRDNNLNLIRMLAAWGVLVSHAYPLTQGPEAVEPLRNILGMTLGSTSVLIFFTISGFLITQSFDRSSSTYRWMAARALRILPGLAIVILLTVFVLGPVVTKISLAQYFSDPATYNYIWRNLTLLKLQYELPGVFLQNPFGPAINGSLWTLVHEVACYFGVLLAGLLGLISSRIRLTLVLIVYFCALIGIAETEISSTLPDKLNAFLELSFPFAIGVGFYAWREKIRLNWATAVMLTMITTLMANTDMFKLGVIVTLCYWVFLLGYVPKGVLLKYNHLGDFSYGTYIYAFPVQQLLMHVNGEMSVMSNIVLSTLITIGLAILSWRYVEEPALRLKPKRKAKRQI